MNAEWINIVVDNDAVTCLSRRIEQRAKIALLKDEFLWHKIGHDGHTKKFRKRKNEEIAIMLKAKRTLKLWDSNILISFEGQE